MGDEVILRWDTIRREAQLLNLLTPTDCVRDRLAAAIHWHDASSIHQAAAVALGAVVRFDGPVSASPGAAQVAAPPSYAGRL